MRIPSLSRIPKYRQFNYTPRFYDPVKEDLAIRTERIKGQIQNKNNGIHRSNISFAFSKRTRENKQSNIRQLAIIILTLGTFFGYIYYGSTVFYIFLLLIPLYLFFRIRKSNKRKQV